MKPLPIIHPVPRTAKRFSLNDRLSQSQVMIAHSHKDRANKKALCSYFSALEKVDIRCEWLDDDIKAGHHDWEGELRQTMVRADIIILLITANFLNSSFISNRMASTLLQRRHREGLDVFPVIAESCIWQIVDWLELMEVRPKSARPLWGHGGDYAQEELPGIVNEIVTRIFAVSPSLNPCYNAFSTLRQQAPLL